MLIQETSQVDRSRRLWCTRGRQDYCLRSWLLQSCRKVPWQKCSLYCRYGMQQSCPLHAYAWYCLPIRDCNSVIARCVLANTMQMRRAMHLVCTPCNFQKLYLSPCAPIPVWGPKRSQSITYPSLAEACYTLLEVDMRMESILLSDDQAARYILVAMHFLLQEETQSRSDFAVSTPGITGVTWCYLSFQQLVCLG